MICDGAKKEKEREKGKDKELLKNFNK